MSGVEVQKGDKTNKSTHSRNSTYTIHNDLFQVHTNTTYNIPGNYVQLDWGSIRPSLNGFGVLDLFQKI